MMQFSVHGARCTGNDSQLRTRMTLRTAGAGTGKTVDLPAQYMHMHKAYSFLLSFSHPSDVTIDANECKDDERFHFFPYFFLYQSLQDEFMFRRAKKRETLKPNVSYIMPRSSAGRRVYGH